MKKKWLLICSLLLGVCFAISPPKVAAAVADRPVGTTVLDETGSLSQETIDSIDQENRSWQSTQEQLQVAVYVTEQLDGSLEEEANETFRKWQVGFSGTNNGVLLFIAMEDRKFRIETSDNAATVLTDVESNRILEDSRTFFRKGNYDAGVEFIVTAIGDRFYGTDRAQKQLNDYEEDSDDNYGLGIFIFILLLVFVTIRNVIGRGGGRGGDGGSGTDLLWWFLLSSGDSSDSSSYSDHDSWSGGGGGGGGASSDW